MQLDAFLRSYAKNVVPLVPLHVITQASTDRHAEAYAEAFRRHSWAVELEQGDSFKDDLLALIPSSESVIFFVDDQIFIRPWIVDERPGLSLRLGLNLTRDYAYGDAPQAVPLYEVLDDERITWRWADGQISWGYPLSVDGHVFDAAEVRKMIEAIEFHSPNTLESGLQGFLPRFLERRGVCYLASKVVNVPWNRVQTDWVNRSAEAMSADDMLKSWGDGWQIAISALQGVENVSVHQEFPLELERRDA